MVNRLQEGNNDLPRVDYLPILDAILREIRQQKNWFQVSEDGRRLLVKIDAIAGAVADQRLVHPILGSLFSVRAASINFNPSCQAKFPDRIREIRAALWENFVSSLGAKGLEADNFISSITQDILEFKKSSESLDLSYPFSPQNNLHKQRLNIQSEGQGSGSLKFHKLTITVKNTNEFSQNLQQELRRYIDEELHPENDDDKDDLHEILTDLTNGRDSDFIGLQRLVNEEVLGQLKKEAKIRYLQVLEQHIKATSPNHENIVYLTDLIRRLKLINQYINNPDKSDADYDLTYQDKTVNLRQLFSRSEAFDALPVIPIIEGYLGETTDTQKGLRKFIFGLKLKLNGAASAQGGKSSFDYHIDLINKLTDSSDREISYTDTVKGLKTLFLYFFIFASRSKCSSEDYDSRTELDYDPTSRFDEMFINQFSRTNLENQKISLQKFTCGLTQIDAKEKVNRLVKLLKTELDKKGKLPVHESCLNIGVSKKILKSDVSEILNSDTLFKEDIRKPKQALQYLRVGSAAVDPSCLSQLPVSFEIRDIRYQEAGDRQSFSMSYNLDKLQVLPIILLPKKVLTDQKIYREELQNSRKSVIYYCDVEKHENLDNQQLFLYRFTFSLLFYISSKLLVDSLANKPNLFLPILRLHLTNKDNPAPLEEFMKNLSVVISHLLNEEKYQANSQGFNVQNKPNSYSIKNGLSSLYSRLPKVFNFADDTPIPQLEKLALLIVSSRESDAHYKVDKSQHRYNLMGEVVGIIRRQDSRVELRCLQTFSKTYLKEEMYSNPQVIQDIITVLYKQGYRHFLYLAKAPYTSYLNLTLDKDNLFFMSPSVIDFLKRRHEDIKLYPIFFDKYYVRSLKPLKFKSLYIQDIKELTAIVNDPSQRSAVFFNLFNGIKVGKDEDRFYNGVISYTTLLHTYNGMVENQDIYQGLLEEGTLKKDILQYLTLFHFSRYEAAHKVSLKLDPYQRIIGDNSVAKLCLFPHIDGKIIFNSLAFLTKVKEALNIEEKKS